MAGFTVILNGPQGPIPVAPNQIQNATSTGFVLQGVAVNQPGNYSIQVVNPGGAASNTFTFTVH
ncbi:MAG TPA: hypothetical protein VG096_01515 [Bryobacteraceae bacterium]|nr:hypothetical protein [Bryobacteraceae bacterium]